MRVKKKFGKRVLSCILVSVLLVSLNINPVATICFAIADSGLVDRIGNLKDNLMYLAKNGTEQVYAAESSSSCSCTVNCDHSEEIKKLMGDGKVSLEDIKNSIDKNSTTIVGAIETNGAKLDTISANVIEVNNTLKSISNQLARVDAAIRVQQHEYRVAHLYSLNNEFPDVRWRPTSSDVPYVEDFAIVQGQFANVYSGYWNSEISTITNPGGDKVSRALEVLGYDAIVRREGIVLQKTVIPVGGGNGLSGENTVFEDYEEDGKNMGSALTIATYEQELMSEDSVTWLDAVTMLYKALGQYQYTYQSFMSLDYNITPENSPAFQNLSNPVPTVEADGSRHYNGYSFKVFLSRSNVITSSPSSDNMHEHKNVYWDKALCDQVIPVGITMETTIDGAQFCRLAHRLMVAYGEPEMIMDETMALLQVYGTDFPISMGITTADAWAYLKVRGCLSDGVISTISKTLTLNDLLDVCMRIKDKDSRLDYKSIDVVLDIGELLRDDGYYPVKDLKFSEGEFNTDITYDYSADNTWEYFVAITNDMEFPSDCSVLILGDTKLEGKKIEDVIKTEDFKNGKDKSPYIDGAEVLSLNYSLNNADGILIRVPKYYKGNIYLYPYKPGDSIELVGSSKCNGLCIPSNFIGGGVYSGGLFLDSSNGLWTVSDSTSWHSWDDFTAIESTLEYCDYKRAGLKDRPTVAVVPRGGTLMETLIATVDKWTSPMTVKADGNSGEGKTKYTVSLTDLDDDDVDETGVLNYTESGGKTIDSVKHVDSDIILSFYPSSPEITDLWKQSNDSTVTGINIADSWTYVLLNRLYYAGQQSAGYLRESVDGIKGTDGYYSYKRAQINDDNGELYGTISVVAGIPNATPLSAFSVMKYGAYTTDDIPADSRNSKEFPRRKLKSGEEGYFIVTGYSDCTIAYRASDMLFTMSSGFNDIFARYVLAASPGESISPNNQPGSFNDDIPRAPREHFDSSKEDEQTKAFNTMVTNMLADSKHIGIDQDIASLIRENKYYKSEYSSKNGYSFYFDSASLTGPNRLGDMIGNAENGMGSGISNILNIDMSVSDSAIMSRDEEKLLSWKSLVNAGIVYNGVGGERPKPDSTGCYYFMTKDGQVKVNPRLSTVQVGTTLYDLMPVEGSGPILVYTDPDTNEMYIDIRCVMGNIQQGWVRNDDATATLLKNSIGSGNYVVYDICSNGIESSIFKAYDIACYNFPAVPVSGSNSLCDSDLMGYYTIKTLKQTAYDNLHTIKDNPNDPDHPVLYWDDTNHYNDFSRIALSSFCPTANWITVIDDSRTIDGSKGELTASLFVYYPREPFVTGFDNLGNHSDGKNLDSVWVSDTSEMDKRFANWQSVVEEANTKSPAGNSATLREALANAYTDNPQMWFDRMSCEAIANLYKMTGRYYISPDFVVREFKLDLNKYNYVNAWDNYDGLIGSDDPSAVKSVTNGEKTSYYYDNAANAPGAIYWLEGIGFVYNMPTTSQFTLEKYFSGLYPLPIAYNKDEAKYTKPCIINYNMNSWGKWQSVNDDGTVKQNNAVPYGYTLAKDGYVHYKDTSVYFSDTKSKFPDLKKSGCTVLPFIDDQTVDGSMKPAAAGVFYSFGGNPYEISKVSSLTQYNTQQNYFFWGTTRVVMTASDNSTDKLFKYISNDFASTAIPGVAAFNRVFSSRTRDMLVYNGNVTVASTSLVSEVDINDYAVGRVENPLDKLGATDLLRMIDEGASFAIVFSFEVFPIIGVILMMFLVGLSFVNENVVVQKICEKTIDPVRILTLGHKNINTWSWKKVLIPCTLLLCMFALFYNGNLIRMVQYLSEWYGTIMKFAKKL